MKAAVDLHIHTALSPCAEEDMTPNNIVNMALLKGLDIIAVTDHNCVENFPAVAACAKAAGIVAVPGMEVETREEVHLVCIFPDYDSALRAQSIVQEAMPDIENNESIFGRQLLMDENDEITGTCRRLLVTAADLGTDEVYELVRGMEGAVIPAHIDRSSYSILSNLGSIPEGMDFKFLEVSKSCETKFLIKAYPFLENFNFIKSSDAHRLGDILERESFMEIDELSARGLIKGLGF